MNNPMQPVAGAIKNGIKNTKGEADQPTPFWRSMPVLSSLLFWVPLQCSN